MATISTNKRLIETLRSSNFLLNMSSQIKIPEIFDSAEFVNVNNCYCISSLYQSCKNAALDLLPDETGFECYVNHVHIDDYNRDEQLETALLVCTTIEEKWLGSPFGFQLLRQIISYSDSSCVYRCHVVREGQSWLASNLAKYEELIIVIDSTFNPSRVKMLSH